MIALAQQAREMDGARNPDVRIPESRAVKPIARSLADFVEGRLTEAGGIQNELSTGSWPPYGQKWVVTQSREIRAIVAQQPETGEGLIHGQDGERKSRAKPGKDRQLPVLRQQGQRAALARRDGGADHQVMTLVVV